MERCTVGGDGAVWIRKAPEYVPHATYRLDPFHLQQALREGLGHDARVCPLGRRCSSRPTWRPGAPVGTWADAIPLYGPHSDRHWVEVLRQLTGLRSPAA